MMDLRSPAQRRRRIARALPLALGLLGSVATWLPAALAGPCQWIGCASSGTGQNGDYCHQETPTCSIWFGNYYWKDTTTWTRTPCNNGDYIISGCSTFSNGCCGATNDGPSCTDGSYC